MRKMKQRKHGRKQVTKKINRSNTKYGYKVRKKAVPKTAKKVRKNARPVRKSRSTDLTPLLMETEHELHNYRARSDRNGLAFFSGHSRYGRLPLGVSSRESQDVLQHRERERRSDILQVLTAMGG